MIQDAAIAGREGAPSAAEEPSRTKAAFDQHLELRCHDQRRFWSSAVTRAFASVIRASSLGSQSEVSRPDEVMLREPDVDTSDKRVVRGVD
jgi:hypothetical protein